MIVDEEYVAYVCPECLGPNIQSQSWTDPNTDELIDYQEGTYEWCPDCEKRGVCGEFKYAKEFVSQLDLKHLRVTHSVLNYNMA